MENNISGSVNSCPDTSLAILPDDPLTRERLVQTAWRHARDIAHARERIEYENEIAILAARLVETEARATHDREATHGLRQLIVALDHAAPTRAPSALEELKAQLCEMEGPVVGAERILHFDTKGLRDFMLLGQLEGAESVPPSKRAALIAFRFLNAEGREIEPPSWTQKSQEYGLCRYIALDTYNWFEHDIHLPEGTAQLDITFHDLRPRKSRFTLKNSMDRKQEGPLVLSRLTAVARDMMILDHSSAAVEPNARLTEPDGLLVVDARGAETLLSVPPGTRAAQFEIALSVAQGDETVIMAQITALSQAGETRTYEVTVSGPDTRLALACHAETPFTYVILRLVARDPNNPVILANRRIRLLGSFPDGDLVGLLRAAHVPLARLNGLVRDWEARSKWFCVYDDPPDPMMPLLAMRRVDDETGPLALDFTVVGAAGGGSTRKGMVLSVCAFDADGHRIKIEDRDFTYSNEVGYFKYIRVDEGAHHVLERLPAPPGARYIGVCVKAWHHKAFARIGAAPVFCPVEDCARAFEEIHLRPLYSGRLPWHGVYAITDQGVWSSLTPNYWQTPLSGDTAATTEPATAVAIRLGVDAENSNWRDITQGNWSPDIKALRAIIVAAQGRKLPIRLYLERMDESDILPYFLLPLASRIIVTEEQAARLISLVEPSRLSVVQRPPPRPESAQ